MDLSYGERLTSRQDKVQGRHPIERHFQELCAQNVLAWLNDRVLHAEDNVNRIQTRVKAYHEIERTERDAEKSEEKKARLAREENQGLGKKRLERREIERERRRWEKREQWGSGQARAQQEMEGDQMVQAPNMPHELDNEKHTSYVYDTNQDGAFNPSPLSQFSRLSHTLQHLNLQRTSEAGTESSIMRYADESREAATMATDQFHSESDVP